MLTPRELHASRLRAARAQLALVPDRYNDKREAQFDTEAAVSDLLANLMHFCATLGIDFEDRMRMASFHYEEERVELDDTQYLKRLVKRARRRYEENNERQRKLYEETAKMAAQISKEDSRGKA